MNWNDAVGIEPLCGFMPLVVRRVGLRAMDSEPGIYKDRELKSAIDGSKSGVTVYFEGLMVFQ